MAVWLKYGKAETSTWANRMPRWAAPGKAAQKGKGSETTRGSESTRDSKVAKGGEKARVSDPAGRQDSKRQRVDKGQRAGKGQRSGGAAGGEAARSGCKGRLPLCASPRTSRPLLSLLPLADRLVSTAFHRVRLVFRGLWLCHNRLEEPRRAAVAAPRAAGACRSLAATVSRVAAGKGSVT